MKQTAYPFQDMDVKNLFLDIDENERSALMRLRELIFDTAIETEGVGTVLETLKWGQPAYLTPATKSGSTIRLGIPKEGGFAIYVHCQTRILSDFKILFPTEFSYEGNRAIHFKSGDRLDLDKLKFLIRNALTYHLQPVQ